MNKVVLMGRLTKDPEVRYTQSNAVVASFSIAVNRRFVKPGEERQADFFNIVAWNKTGEFVSKYFKKGQQVAITGRLQTRNWEDEKGKHYATDVIAEEVDFAEGRRDSEASTAVFAEDDNTDALPTGEDDASEFQVTSGDDLPF